MHTGLLTFTSDMRLLKGNERSLCVLGDTTKMLTEPVLSPGLL